MDKIQLDTLRFLYQQDKTCKASDIRKVVDFTGSNLQFLNHLFSLFPKYITQQQDRLTITNAGKSLLLEEDVHLTLITEKEELELNELRENHLDKPQKRLYEKWQFYASILGIIGLILGLIKC